MPARSGAGDPISPTAPSERIDAALTASWIVCWTLSRPMSRAATCVPPIAVTASDKLLVFLTRRDVEATNNKSERALRPSVVFRKVTNGFRSEWGAKVYADLCSVVATGRTALAAIRDALAAPAPEQTAA
jgi:Transposase IS66 family